MFPAAEHEAPALWSQITPVGPQTVEEFIRLKRDLLKAQLLVRLLRRSDPDACRTISSQAGEPWQEEGPAIIDRTFGSEHDEACLSYSS